MLVALALGAGGERLGMYVARTRAWRRLLPAAWRARMTGQFDQVSLGLRAMRGRNGFVVLAWSVVVWSLAALTNVAMFKALGLDLPFAAALFVLLIGQAGSTLPAAPGKIGLFEYLVVWSLALFAVDGKAALAVALLLHVAVVVPPALIGLGLVWHQRITVWTRDAGVASDAAAGAAQ